MSLRMPAIWSSSERPISVRTVWVDGVRHAILSADDPIVNKKLQIQNQKESDRELVLEKTKINEKLRRPRPATSMNTRRRIINCSCSSRSSSDNSEKNFYNEEGDDEDEDQGGNNYYGNDLRECLVKLRVVVKNDEKTAECSSPSSPRILSNRENDFGSCHGLLFSKTNQTRIYDSPYNYKPQKSHGFLKSHCDFNYCEKTKKVLRDEPSSGGNPDALSKLPEIQNNSLSERVLQWLDISGKVKNYDINKNDDHNSSIFGGNFFHRKKITPLFLGGDTDPNNRNHLSRRRSSSAVIRNHNNNNNNNNNDNHHHSNHKKEERIITRQNYALNTTTTTTTTMMMTTTTDLNFVEKGKDLNCSREMKVKTRELGDKNCHGRRGSFLSNNNNNNNNNNDDNQQRDDTSGTLGTRSYFPIDAAGTGEMNNGRLKLFYNEKEEEDDDDDDRDMKERQNVWSPPRKPQLHIFMPSLTTAHNYYPNSDKIVMSSLESVRD